MTRRFRIKDWERACLVMVLMLVLASGVGSSPASLSAATPDPWTILPGQGIGSLRLGMTVLEAIAASGAPTVTWGRPGLNTVLLWFDAQDAKKTHQGGLFAVGAPSAVIRDGAMLRTDVVINVGVVLDSRCVTAEGLHTGVAEGEVTTVLGNAPRVVRPGVDFLDGKFDQNIHTLKYAGVEFGVRDSSVIQITVTPYGHLDGFGQSRCESCRPDSFAGLGPRAPTDLLQQVAGARIQLRT